MAKHMIVLSPPDASPTHSALYRVDSKHREHKREGAAQLEKASIAESTVVEGASSKVSTTVDKMPLQYGTAASYHEWTNV